MPGSSGEVEAVSPVVLEGSPSLPHSAEAVQASDTTGSDKTPG